MYAIMHVSLIIASPSLRTTNHTGKGVVRVPQWYIWNSWS